MKKLIALVLALALVFAVAVASAATITIQSTSSTTAAQTETTEYTYYRIFDASILSSGTVDGDTGELTRAGVVSYSIPATNDTLADNVNGLTVGGDDLFKVELSSDGTKYIVSLNDHNPAFTGAQIAEALSASSITSNALGTGTFAQTTPGGTASEDGLAAGYYLILSSLGTKMAVQTLDDVTIKEKNEYFTNVKTEDKANVSVGDTVNYTITVHVPATVAVNDVITVHDTLDDRLSIDANTIRATIDGDSSKPVTLEDGTKDANTEDFAKQFTVLSTMLNHDVVLTYSATVLNTAVSDTGFINSSFANDDHYKTKPSEVKTYTFDFNLNKTFTGATGSAANYTAEFELYDSVGTKLKFVQNVKDSNDETDPLKYTYDPAGSVTKLTIHHGETINVKGLKAGTYTLKEISTKDGYNLMTDDISVTITDNTPDDKKATTTTPAHTVTYQIGSATATTGTVTVVNNQGTTLPSTGGIGTTIFYILGGLLVVGAAVILVARRKASN